MFCTWWWTCLLPSSGFCVNITLTFSWVIRISSDQNMLFWNKIWREKCNQGLFGQTVSNYQVLSPLNRVSECSCTWNSRQTVPLTRRVGTLNSCKWLATAREFSSPAITNNKECPMSSMTTHQALHFACIILFSPHSLKGTCYCLYL